MNDAQRKRLCALVMKFCFLRSFKEISVADIENKIITTTQCRKMKFSIWRRDDGPFTKKQMFQCPRISFQKQQKYIYLEEFHLSAGGKLNAALVFFNARRNNGVNFLYIGRYVENLAFETNESRLLPV